MLTLLLLQLQPIMTVKKNFFDCSAVEAVIELVLKVNPNATMIIKSTIPVGYTASVREKIQYKEYYL